MKMSRESAMRFVWLIGIVSLFSDMTYQGAHGNAGPYLSVLGASGTVVGVVAGAGEFVNWTLRLLFGYWADRSQKYWLMAFPGYALNLIAVPLLAFAGHWPAAAALLILERTGKGIRTPARDVMLSHAADKVGRGRAFGIHEALDQTGGMLGPLLVAAMLFFRQGYRASFGVLVIPAGCALICLTATWLLYKDPEEFHAAPPSPRRVEVTGLTRSFWLLVAAFMCLAAGYADFALMAFHFKRLALMAAAGIPLCYAAAMGLEGVASYVFGNLFDRQGTKALLWASVPAAAFAPLAFSRGLAPALAGVALWAIGMGAQSSIMKAKVAELVPAERRGSAYGIVNSLYGVTWFAGSAIMGFLYDRSLVGLMIFSVLIQLVSLPILLSLKPTPDQ